MRSPQVGQSRGRPCSPLWGLATGDLTDAGDIGRIAAAATAALGRIDILVNSAGGSRPITTQVRDVAWDEAFALNFSATRRLTEAVLPAMRAQRWGRVLTQPKLADQHVEQMGRML